MESHKGAWCIKGYIYTHLYVNFFQRGKGRTKYLVDCVRSIREMTRAICTFGLSICQSGLEFGFYGLDRDFLLLVRGLEYVEKKRGENRKKKKLSMFSSLQLKFSIA